MGEDNHGDRTETCCQVMVCSWYSDGIGNYNALFLFFFNFFFISPGFTYQFREMYASFKPDVIHPTCKHPHCGVTMNSVFTGQIGHFVQCGCLCIDGELFKKDDEEGIFLYFR
jgi:hypothetical protein